MPSDWAKKSVWLYIEGSFHATTSYLNGVQIGEHDKGVRGWDERFEIALGDAVKIGESNTLAVRVRDRSHYGGIWKPVKRVREKRVD